MTTDLKWSDKIVAAEKAAQNPPQGHEIDPDNKWQNIIMEDC